MKKILVLVLMLVSLGIARAQEPDPDVALVDIKNYKLVTLPNGFRVQVITSSEYKYCNCRLTADVANIDEGDFVGIKNVVAAITGSEIIANEMIVKNMVSHDKALDSIMNFVSESVYGKNPHNLKFGEYKRKRTEYLQSHANDVITKVSAAATYQIGRTPLPANFMSGITESDYLDYRKMCFSPDRCLLTVCSDMSAAEIEELAAKYFGDAERQVAKTKAPSVNITPKDKVFFINDTTSSDVSLSYKDYFPCIKTPKNYVLNKVALHILFGGYVSDVVDYSTYNYDIYSLEIGKHDTEFNYLFTHIYHPRNEDYLINTSLPTAKEETVADFKNKLKFPDYACELASYLILYKFPNTFFSEFERAVYNITEQDALSFIKTINQNGANVMVINGNQRNLHCALGEIAVNREVDILTSLQVQNLDVMHVFPKGFSAKSVLADYVKSAGLNNPPKNLSVNFRTVYDFPESDAQYKAEGKILRKQPNMYRLDNYILHLDSIRTFHYKELYTGTTPYDSTKLYGLEFVSDERANVLKMKATFPIESNYEKFGIEPKLICDYDLFTKGYYKIQVEDLNGNLSNNYFNIKTCMKDKVELLDSLGHVLKTINYEYEQQGKYLLPKLIREQTKEQKSETLFSTYDFNATLKKTDFMIGLPSKKK